MIRLDNLSKFAPKFIDYDYDHYAPNKSDQDIVVTFEVGLQLVSVRFKRRDYPKFRKKNFIALAMLKVKKGEVATDFPEPLPTMLEALNDYAQPLLDSDLIPTDPDYLD